MKKAVILSILAGLLILSASAKKPTIASMDQAEQALGENKIVPVKIVIDAWKKIGVDIKMFADTTLPSLELIQEAAELNLKGYNIFLIPIFKMSVDDLRKFYSNMELYTTAPYQIGYRLINIPETGEAKNDIDRMRANLPKNNKMLESMVIYQSFATLHLSGYFRPSGIVMMPIPENEFSVFNSDENKNYELKMVCGILIGDRKSEIIYSSFPKKFTCCLINNKKITYHANNKKEESANALTYLKISLIPDDEDYFVAYAFSL